MEMELLTTEQAAEYLGVSPDWLKTLRSKKAKKRGYRIIPWLISHPSGGHTLRVYYKKSDLDAYRDARYQRIAK